MVSSPPTFSLQYTLPRLPVPRLEETCSLYLKSIVPFQTPEEHEKTKSIVNDFVNSKLAKSLQQRLIDIDHHSPNNWLEDNFWLRKAYLEWREPLMVNSNWYILGQPDKNHPTLETRKSGTFSYFQVRRAAHMIMRGLKYKEMVDRQEIPVDMMRGNKAQCMWQYSRIFSVTRVPLYHCDTLVQADASQIHHIIVLVRDQVYKLPVYKEIAKDIWQLLSTDEIEQGLLDIVHAVSNMDTRSAPVPLFTSWDRDSWTTSRNHLLSIDPSNREHFDTIESALFAVALDDYSNGLDNPSFTKTMFCGHQGLGNGHNRWYDKSFTLIVENTGACGFSGEHSPVDALIVSYIFDYMLQEPTTGNISSDWIQKQQDNRRRPAHHLKFKTDDMTLKYLEQAQKSADATSALSDSDVLVFKDYGTQWVKKSGRVPPDAFFQMALQLTFYRLHQSLTPVYETASTRKYLRGRTETIRSTSSDSKAFLEAFDNPTFSAKEKYDLLAKATDSHRKYTAIASDGHGCDRHLLVLRILNSDHQEYKDGKLVAVPMHPLFTDPIFQKSQVWRLSTSGLHAGIRLMGTGFGAVYPDGYGINYMAAPNLVKFGVESKRVKESATTKEFIDALDKVLKDLRILCEQVNGAKL